MRRHSQVSIPAALVEGNLLFKFQQHGLLSGNPPFYSWYIDNEPVSLVTYNIRFDKLASNAELQLEIKIRSVLYCQTLLRPQSVCASMFLKLFFSPIRPLQECKPVTAYPSSVLKERHQSASVHYRHTSHSYGHLTAEGGQR